MHYQKAIRAACVGVVALASGQAIAQPHEHQEIQIGRDSAGMLHMHTHEEMPFLLEPSEFPGIPGYASVEIAFASLPADHTTIDLFELPATADIRAIFVGADQGMRVLDGGVPLSPGQQIALGSPVIHYLPVWNLTSGEFGQEYGLQMYFHDASGQLADSEVFTLTFSPVPTPGGLGVFALAWCGSRRRR